MHDGPDDAAWLTREATRLHERYVREVVIAFGLCPWASPAFDAGRTLTLVVAAGTREDAERQARDALAVLGTDSTIDVGFVVLPRWRVSAAELDAFVVGIGQAQAGRFPLGEAPLAFAPFHPEAPCDDATPERLVPFLRRTPSPTIQAVRVPALERVRRNHGHGTELVDVASLDDSALLATLEQVPLAAEVARVNHERLQTQDARRALLAVLDDIAADHANTFGRSPPRAP